MSCLSCVSDTNQAGTKGTDAVGTNDVNERGTKGTNEIGTKGTIGVKWAPINEICSKDDV